MLQKNDLQHNFTRNKKMLHLVCFINNIKTKKAPHFCGALKYFVQRDIITSARSIINYAL